MRYSCAAQNAANYFHVDVYVDLNQEAAEIDCCVTAIEAFLFLSNTSSEDSQLNVDECWQAML
jgi:hypothetical protein